jgi:excinuclease UvrABC nuclease subunit
MKTGIYKITNQINNKFYIGSSKDLSRRKKDHFRLLKKGVNHSVLLQRAVNKYGIDNFIFEIIVECSQELLFTIEQKLVDDLSPEYNIAIEDVSVPIGLPYKDKSLYKKYAKSRLKNNDNFGWKSRVIIKVDNEGNELKEYPSLKSYAVEHKCAIGSVGKALKKGTRCKGFYLKYKD